MSLGAEDDLTPGPRRGIVAAPWRKDVLAGRGGPLRPVEDPIDFENDDDGAFDLLHYWHLIVKYRWLLAAALVIGLAVGAVVTLLTPPLYRATATVQIDEEPQKVVAVESQKPVQSAGVEKFYQTQYELLKSRALAQRVAVNERLADDSRFLRTANLQESAPVPERAAAAAREARTEAAATQLSKNLIIEPVRLSRIVKVSYESPDPATAARIANAVAANYIEWNLERRFNASADARRFLEDRLSQTRQALEASQRRGNDYAQKNELITIGDASASDSPAATGESLAAADLSAVNQQLATATATRIQAEQRWRQAVSTPDLALPELLSNAAAQTLKATRDTAWAEYQQNLRLYKPDYPAMLEAKRKIDTLDQQLAAQADSIRRGLQTEYEIARNNQAQLQGQVNQRKRELLESQGKRVEQSFINTDIATSKTLYEGMLASYKEIGIAGAIGENNISIVDRAEAPKKPVKPQPKRNLLLFGLLGLAAGAALTFLLDLFDTNVMVPDDVERTLGLPLLGTIPVARKDLPPIKALEDAKSNLSEAYYSVRSALQFSTEDGVPPSLLVTSPRPGEGKTTSSLALSTGFARLGLNVLLIDGDMRDPSLHKLLARDNGVGLSNLLASGPEMAPAIQPTNYKNLSFLACGPLPPNPAELLGGGKMRAFLQAAREEFDLVVIDGPPVMGLADAPQLASVVAGTILVVEAGRTKRDLARAVIRRLRMSQPRILGAILTKFDLKKAGYAYGHAYGYGYGYGYGYEYGVKPQPALARSKFLPSRAWFGGGRGRG